MDGKNSQQLRIMSLVDEAFKHVANLEEKLDAVLLPANLVDCPREVCSHAVDRLQSLCRYIDDLSSRIER